MDEDSANVNIPIHSKDEMIELLEPQMFGFAEKFKKWRPNQEQAILQALNGDHRFIGQSHPTGAGKSLMSVFRTASARFNLE